MTDQNERTKATLNDLMGENWDSLLKKIPRSVLIRISPEAINDLTGQLISAFTINMITRLFPVVTNVYLQASTDASLQGNIPKYNGNTFLSSVKDMYDSVKPSVKLHINSKPNENEISCHITISSGPSMKIPGVWVGSNNWVAKLSSLNPQEIRSRINPVGAYTAATLAVSEAWKRILVPLQEHIKFIKIAPLDGTLNFSTIDYTTNGNGANPAMPEKVDLKRVTMIGLGAGGGAAAYTLASIPKVYGTITLIDPDEIEPSNLNRYVYADYYEAKERKPKVELIKKLFKANNGITFKAIHKPFNDAIDELEVKDYELVLAAVDNRETRRGIQDETPKIIIDAAATGKGDFYNWRMIFGETECMFCKHPQNKKDKDIEQAVQLSRKLGLSPEDWLNKSSNNHIFTTKDVENISLKIEDRRVEVELPKVGQRFQEWFKKNCGRLKLPNIEGEIPIPFAPIMAGILQAGEAIKEQLFPEHTLKGYYWNTLTAKFNPNIIPRLNPPKKECSFCSNKIFKEQYQRRWNPKN